MIDVLWLRGTGHGAVPDGVSEEFAKFLDPDRFRFRAVEYPADYGQVLSYAESVQIGVSNLDNAAMQSPNPVVIGGYSQGAAAAGDLAAAVAAGAHPYLDVRGVALIADPLRPAGAGMPGLPAAAGYGISGQRLIGMPTLWAANDGDPITALPAGNPLRTVADVSEFLAATCDPSRAADLFVTTLRAVTDGRMQRWWDVSNWRTWGGALAYLRGYLFDGRHTDDYIRRGLCAELAAAVNDTVHE